METWGRGKQVSAAVLLVAIILVASGCGGKDETGACVRGSGITATCGDDFTSGQCEFIGGDEWYEGRTCADLGFSPNKDVSRLVIAGVARDEAGRLARVTLLNAGPEPRELRGFRLEIRGTANRDGAVALSGVIDACGTRDLALAAPPEAASPRDGTDLYVALH